MAQQPRIDSYEFGRVEINGHAYTSDVIILPTGVGSNWWREQGHTLRLSDLTAVLEACPKVLVIGQGASGRMSVPDETLAHLRQAGIDVIRAPTGWAVEIYNERCGERQPVAAALHLTC